jgi:hypothetical protein
MKTTFLLSASLIISCSALASDASYSPQACQSKSTQLHAQYKITHSSGKSSEFGLWRNHKSIAQYKIDNKVIDLWYQSSHKQLTLSRLYAEYEQGIEYASEDILTYPNLWLDKYQLVPQARMAKLNKLEETGEGCEVVHMMSSNDGTFKLTWLPKLQLAKRIEQATNSGTVVWTLTEISHDKSEIEKQFAVWQAYQTTDYADVGDNESNPVLAKMIRVGFAGPQGSKQSKLHHGDHHGHSHDDDHDH